MLQLACFPDVANPAVTLSEDSPLSPKFLNRSWPARALDADTNISSTSCKEANQKQGTAQTDDMITACEVWN